MSPGRDAWPWSMDLPTCMELEVSALDIRSGAAIVLAGLAAEGTTIVDKVVYIDRGYENIDAKLQQLGAAISRVEETRARAPLV